MAILMVYLRKIDAVVRGLSKNFTYTEVAVYESVGSPVTDIAE